MNNAKKVVSVIAGLVGIFFLLNSASDIQLGFGLVLIVQGMLGFPTK